MIPKIVSVQFTESKMFGPPSSATATMDDGSTDRLFSFYSDELSFSEAELVGLTADEASDLFHKKSVEYLRS